MQYYYFCRTLLDNNKEHIAQNYKSITNNTVVKTRDRPDAYVCKEEVYAKRNWQVNAHEMTYDEVLDRFLALHGFEEVTQKVAEKLFGPSFITLIRDTGKRAGNKVIYNQHDLLKRANVFCRTKTFERKNEFLQMQRYKKAMLLRNNTNQ